ncbi:hypothetical protein QFZ81_003722 [Paenibacillus sp. V4I9]|uniref:hypothetical protein n=1 Tax=Paenibacillus sp. V4I9 TaxID=3042308 RepID=UPI0027839C58|nr:hypothetical protein [Paenibacillus sp. V4I9]MDQ0888634.1 hypothetical protein [Paenibacillus sp. V4I9]
MDYITHYYIKGTLPFRSLSALTESEALKIMENLCDDSPLLSRFKQPTNYMEDRRETEKWLRNSFIEKGGRPEAVYPLYTLLGTSNLIEKNALNYGTDIDRISIPISIFDEHDITFTYPDSMVSYSTWKYKPAAHYQAEYHGLVFTLSEAKAKLINNITDLLGEKWTFSEETLPYIEAQIWNHKKVLTYAGIT